MRWEEVRTHYPQQWVLIESVDARSEDGQRILEQVAVVDSYPDSPAAMQAYRTLHQASPQRELYVLHTQQERIEITERRWVGLRALG